jgi:hypothetical protein
MRTPGTQKLLAAAAVAVCLALLLPAPSVRAQQEALKAHGFNTPTLAGDWRFRVALNGWIPDAVPVHISTKGKSDSTTLYPGFFFNHLGYAIPLDFEARKGSFGSYVHTISFRLVGTTRARRAVITWKSNGYLIDTGLSYELGRWALGGGACAPVLTVEPFVGARLLYEPANVNLTRLGNSATISSFNNYVPDIGIRTFWDLTEHWNLQVEGDYGGFGVDNNRQTWQALALIGYRWQVCRVHWNLQFGYRAMRIFDLKIKGAKVRDDARGPDVVLSFEF